MASLARKSVHSDSYLAKQGMQPKKASTARADKGTSSTHSGGVRLEARVRLGRHDERPGLFSDPAFKENHTRQIHRWVPWIAGFSAQFVSDAIQRFHLTPSDDTRIFDPFAGVATTLVQGKLEGFDVAGAEINAFAILAAKAKLAWNVDLELFREQLHKLRAFVTALEGREPVRILFESIPGVEESFAADLKQATLAGKPKLQGPKAFRTIEPFFDKQTERKVLLLKEFVLEVPPSIRDLFKVALGAVLVKYSNYAYGPSLGRKSVMDIQRTFNAPVGDELFHKLCKMYEDLQWVQKQVLDSLPRKPKHEVFPMSIFAVLDHLQDKSIDLVVTSPPYLNNYHYPRNTRPQLYWLDLIERPEDLEKTEWESFGKFWQTVRELPPIELQFEMRELQEIIAQIRGRNTHKGIYGGHGWANYVATYFNDVFRFFDRFGDKMKPGGAIVWVIGNSIIQGVELPTDDLTAKIAQEHGFAAELFRVRKKRIGSSIINTSVRAGRPGKSAELYEAAVVLRR